MADHIQIPILDQTPPSETIKVEIGGGKKVDHSIVDIMETNGQISDERLKSTTIFKVNVGLRESNPAAYIPKLISIGPYHNKNPELCSMEKYKLLYLRRFLNRKEGIDVKSCMRELEKLKDIALMCYDDIENLDEDIVGKFSEIMLLDGCFSVEFIRERCEILPGGEEEHYQKVIDKEWMINQVCRDMVVLENQLPFFVLTMLHDMTKCPNEESFLYMVRGTLLQVSPKVTYIPKSEIDRLNAEQFDHLLHVLHMVSCPSERINSRQRTDATKKKGFCNINIFFGKILQRMKRSKEIPPRPSEMIKSSGGTDDCLSEMIKSSEGTDASKKKGFCNTNIFFGNILKRMKRSKEIPDNSWHWGNIPSATELYEAGVSFTKIGSVEEDDRDTATLLEIKYESGLLEIPCFLVGDSSEIFFRNLIAYEQHSSNVKPYFSDYVHIMDQLIDSPKDVKLLRESGIIINYLGDDKAVAKIFNKLGDGVLVDSTKSYYTEECSKLNQHCQKRWNKMMANLRHNYFHSLWAGTSTLAAIVLLILTAMQTVLAFRGSVK